MQEITVTTQFLKALDKTSKLNVTAKLTNLRAKLTNLRRESMIASGDSILSLEWNDKDTNAKTYLDLDVYTSLSYCIYTGENKEPLEPKTFIQFGINFSRIQIDYLQYALKKDDQFYIRIYMDNIGDCYVIHSSLNVTRGKKFFSLPLPSITTKNIYGFISHD